MSTPSHRDTASAGFGTGQAVLDAVVAAARGEQRCAAEKLAAALAWAQAHPGSEGDCASWEPQRRFGLARERGEDCLDYLGGQGLRRWRSSRSSSWPPGSTCRRGRR